MPNLAGRLLIGINRQSALESEPESEPTAHEIRYPAKKEKQKLIVK